MEKQLDAIDGINWLFNEHLAFRFTPRHKLIFEEKIHETRKIIDSIRTSLSEIDRRSYAGQMLLHAQAA